MVAGRGFKHCTVGGGGMKSPVERRVFNQVKLETDFWFVWKNISFEQGYLLVGFPYGFAELEAAVADPCVLITLTPFT